MDSELDSNSFQLESYLPVVHELGLGLGLGLSHGLGGKIHKLYIKIIIILFYEKKSGILNSNKGERRGIPLFWC